MLQLLVENNMKPYLDINLGVYTYFLKKMFVIKIFNLHLSLYSSLELYTSI